MYGSCWPRNAAWRPSNDLSRLALRLVSRSGLSSLRSRVWPGGVRRHVPASPRSSPGQLLISIRNTPLGLTTSVSTSPIEPSRTNSKFAHARYGSWSGRLRLRNASASRSQANSDGVTWIQLRSMSDVVLKPWMPAAQEIAEQGRRVGVDAVIVAIDEVVRDQATETLRDCPGGSVSSRRRSRSSRSARPRDSRLPAGFPGRRGVRLGIGARRTRRRARP